VSTFFFSFFLYCVQTSSATPAYFWSSALRPCNGPVC